MSSAIARRLARAAPAPAPSLAVRLGVDSGIQRLIETALVINGAAGSTILQFRGSDAGAGGWAELGGAGTLALQSGTVPTYGVASPYLRSGEGGCKLNGGGYFRATDASLGNRTTEDLVVEVLIQLPPTMSATEVPFDKFLNSGSVGVQHYITTSGVYHLYLRDGATSADVAAAAVALGGVYLVHAFADASGSCQIYINGAASGSAVAISAVGSTGSATARMCIGANYNATAKFNGTVLYSARHIRSSGWLDTHLQATLAANRFALLTASRPLISIAATPATYPAAGGNVGPAYQSRIVSGADGLFYMGAGAPRFVERLDSAGRTFLGALVEAGATNLCLQSQNLALTWNNQMCTAPATSVVCPDGIARTTCTWHEDASVTTTHYSLQTIATTATLVFSLFFKAANRAFVVLGLDSNNKIAYYNLTTGAIGTKSGVQTSGVIACGNGWYRCWISAEHTSGNEIRIHLASADNVSSFTGLNQDSIYGFGAQVETGTYSSSYIPTTTTAVTRAADAPHRYSGAAHFGAGCGALFFRFLGPSFTPGRSHYLLTAYKAGSASTDYLSLYIDTSGRLNVASAATGGNAGAVQLAGSLANDLVHDVAVSWEKNRLRLWVDRVEATPDTSCDFCTTMDTLDVGADNAAGNQAGPFLVGDIRLCTRPAMSAIILPSGFRPIG